MREVKRVNGPYVFGPNSQTGLVGRAYFTIIYTDGTQSTVLQSRKMMEEHLGRKLRSNEHVDHINGDHTDDRLENLQVLSASEHARKTLRDVEPWNRGKELGFTHGTLYGWMKKKCTCAECASAKRAWHNKRNAARRK